MYIAGSYVDIVLQFETALPYMFRTYTYTHVANAVQEVSIARQVTVVLIKGVCMIVVVRITRKHDMRR